MGLHLIPTAGKRPLVKWRHGARDYLLEPPTPEEIQGWTELDPEGWAVVCGGPSRVVVLDVEAEGWADPGTQGLGIRSVVESLPDTCLRRSPSGGMHAVLRIVDGPAPNGCDGRLVTKLQDGDPGQPVLLAEMRAEGQYAVILGPGRGPLSADFRPHDVTLTDLNNIIRELRGLSEEGHGRLDNGHAMVLDEEDRSWLDLLPHARPCVVVLAHADTVRKALAGDELTPAILAPVTRLMRLAHRGHPGVPETLSVLRTEFLHRVELRGSRPGGQVVAERQWDRSVLGAAKRVGRPTWIDSGNRRVCPCWVDQVLLEHRAARPPFTSKGRARTNEVLVLEHLASWAVRTGEAVVRESQRQISLAVVMRLQSVNATIRRLEEQGWLVRHRGAGKSIHGFELAIPVSITGTTNNTSMEVLLVVPVMDTELHPLFGSGGLGPGPAETLSHLPEFCVRVRRASLVRVSPGTPSEIPKRPPSSRPLPAAFRGAPPTRSELVQLTGKARSTIARHLEKLRSAGLAFQDDSGRWWRYRAHPDWVAERMGVLDPTPARRDLYERQRRAWFLTQVVSGQVQRLEHDDSHTYIDPRSGEILWVDAAPPDRSESRDLIGTPEHNPQTCQQEDPPP